MKKNYILLLFTALFSGIVLAQETQKNFINYQGVARNAGNELMSGETMNIGVTLKFGTANGSAIYEENHSITTDANGVFSLLIGNGSPSKGEYNSLPWGSAATFVTVFIDGKEVGTTEMMAVPYAISSGDADNQSAAEVEYDNSSSGLSATTTQEAIDELMTSGSVDADSDPSNEFQMLSFDAVTNELSLSDGNAVTIPSGGTDADADPSNELQTLNFDAGTNELSLSDGNSVTLPSGGTDADADPTNEIQTISFDATSNMISLTDGGEITIPSGGTDADADPENELQTLAFDADTNELSLSDGNAITIPSGGTDADADPTNELQDISLAGTELTISDGSTIDLAPIVPSGGTDNQNLELTDDILSIEGGAGNVDLSTYRNDADADPTNEVDVTAQSGILLGNGTVVTGLEGTTNGQVPKWDSATSSWLAGTDATGGGGSSLWTENGNNIHFDTGNVGIGTTTPDAPFHIRTNQAFSAILETTSSDNYLGFYNNNGYLGYAGSYNGENDMDFGTGAGNSIGKVHLVTDANPRLTVNADGNVGIGTRNPNAKMHVLHDSGISSPQLRLQESSTDYARLEFKNSTQGFWHIAGRSDNSSTNSKLNFYHHDGTTGRDRMTILGNGNVGINTGSPAHKLDVGGSFNINGDFANQGIYQVYLLRGDAWRPPSSASGNEVPFPDASLVVDVPVGSKAMVGYSISGAIDSDKIHFSMYRDDVLINKTYQGCYDVAGSYAQWSFSTTHLDKEVAPGSHTYHLNVYQSDDADDNYWHGSARGGNTASFYVVVIKE